MDYKTLKEDFLHPNVQFRTHYRSFMGSAICLNYAYLN